MGNGTQKVGNGKGKGSKVIAPPVTITEAVADGSAILLPFHLIRLEPGWNARREIGSVKELATTIAEEGQLQAIVVRKRSDGTYHVVAGYRRLLAICGGKDVGGLGRTVIKATVLPGEVTDLTMKEDKYSNLVENFQRDDLSPYDLALSCRDLADLEEQASGKERGGPVRVAARLGVSSGYVRNLIGCLNGLSPVVLARWQEEKQADKSKRPAMEICTTDILNLWSKMTHAEQDLQLRRAMGDKTVTDEDLAKAKAEGAAQRALEGKPEPATPQIVKAKRATATDMAAALQAAIDKHNASTDSVVKKYLDGVIAALRWASCAGSDDTAIIKGVWTGKESKGDAADA